MKRFLICVACLFLLCLIVMGVEYYRSSHDLLGMDPLPALTVDGCDYLIRSTPAPTPPEEDQIVGEILPEQTNDDRCIGFLYAVMEDQVMVKKGHVWYLCDKLDP